MLLKRREEVRYCVLFFNMLKTKPPIFIPSNIQIKLFNKTIFLKTYDEKISLQLPVLSFPTTEITTKLIGLSIKYTVRISFIGVGYRLESINNNILKIKLGFSHFIFVTVPSEIESVSTKKIILTLRSSNFFTLKNFVSKLCLLAPVDNYKGKGIRLKNQSVLLKQGKKK